MTAIEKISRWIEDRKTNSRQFCGAAGLDDSMLSRMKSGKVEMNLDYAVKAAKHMGVSLDWLLDDEQSWPPVDREVPLRANTEHEDFFLKLGHYMSRNDPEPARLEKALSYLTAERSDVGIGLGGKSIADQEEQGKIDKTSRGRKSS